MGKKLAQVSSTRRSWKTDLSVRQAFGALLSVWVLLLGEFAWVTYDAHEGIGIFGHDGLEYYAWLRSPCIDGDVDFENEYTQYDLSHSIARDGWLLALRTPKGLHANLAGIGCALCWSPFFAVACLVSWLSGLPVDGFNAVFQFLMPLGSLIYAGLAMLWIYGICRLCFDRCASVLGCAGIFLGSSLTFLSSHLAMWSHLPALMATSAFLFVALKTDDRRSYRSWMLLGALLSLVTMIRFPTAIVGIVLPVQSLARLLRGNSQPRLRRLAREFLGGMLMLVAACLVFTPQLLAWQALYGSFFVNSYGDPQAIFDWSSPHFISALVSWDHGVVAWTPIVGVAILGLLLSMVSRVWPIALPLFSYALLLAYVIGSCAWWNFSEAYGNRGFSEAAPALAFGLAYLWHGRHFAGFTVTALGVVQNHLLIWAYQNGYVQHPSGYLDILRAYLRILGNIAEKLMHAVG